MRLFLGASGGPELFYRATVGALPRLSGAVNLECCCDESEYDEDNAAGDASDQAGNANPDVDGLWGVSNVPRGGIYVPRCALGC